MTDDLTCFYCPCPAAYRHRTDLGVVGWCEHHYWCGGDLPCPDCEPATEAVA